MDRLDRKILRLLQEDATLAVADVAKKVGLSTTPCWRRIQKLEEEGVIKRRVAILDPVKINARVTVFVSIRTNSHSHEWLRRFSEVIQDFPEVVEFYRMSGDVDYLLRVVVPDIAAYDAFYKRLIAKIEIRDVSSSFAMEQIKYTTEMPLDYMMRREGRQRARRRGDLTVTPWLRLLLLPAAPASSAPVRSRIASLPIQRAVRFSEAPVFRPGRALPRSASRCACRSNAAPSSPPS